MLEHTFSRVGRLIPEERVFTVVGRNHLAYPSVNRQLSGRLEGTVVVQPQNRETGPGILLPLMYLSRLYPDAAVAVFPSDHFVLEEELFMAHVDLALRVVEHHPSYLILLGMEPDGVEREYGYILPGKRIDRLAPLSVREVIRFVEKPGEHTAHRLTLEGGLWNTMVMAFKVKTLLELIEELVPRLCHLFRQIFKAIGTTTEMSRLEEVYRAMDRINFSSGLLQPLSSKKGSRLLVLPVQGITWSDWGSEERIKCVLQKLQDRRPLLEVCGPGAIRTFDPRTGDSRNA
jgi:mannose-1-phosphate guanylyltransferase